MPWIDSLDWLSLNSLRRYPLREGTSLLSDDGYFAIPDTLIVDFSLSATSDVSRRFYISQVFNKITSVVLEFKDDQDTVVGSVEILKATHSQDDDYFLTITNDYVGSNGKITIGTLEDLMQQPAGQFSFLLSSTEFEPRVIVPGIRGIDRIAFIDEQNGTHNLSGDITLATRSNMVFSYAQSTVYLDAGDDLGLSKPCAVTNCVKTINGVVPDPATGDISLLGVDCINVASPAQYTLNLDDTCCTPCSGCTELEELTTRLTSLENKFLDLKTGYNTVNSQLTSYLSTINSNCACPS